MDVHCSLSAYMSQCFYYQHTVFFFTEEGNFGTWDDDDALEGESYANQRPLKPVKECNK